MPSHRYFIAPLNSNGKWCVERETWFIDNRGNKDWRLDTVASFDTRLEAARYLHTLTQLRD